MYDSLVIDRRLWGYWWLSWTSIPVGGREGGREGGMERGGGGGGGGGMEAAMLLDLHVDVVPYIPESPLIIGWLSKCSMRVSASGNFPRPKQKWRPSQMTR